MKKLKELFSIQLFIVFSALVVIILSLSYIQASATLLETTKNKTDIPAYLISSRDGISYKEVQGPGYGNYNFSNTADLFSSCPEEIAVFVHGWNANESQAKEQVDRVKMSLENNSYTYPLVGYSWDSNNVWIASQYIAKWNGPVLADFILNMTDSCNIDKGKDMQIRLIGHSLGSRVILSSLDSLLKNETLNKNNTSIASVHLMGAAVDDEEVTKDPKNILSDFTNWGTVKSDYGTAIEKVVVNFYNLHNPEDYIFEPNVTPAYEIYPAFEGDSALGQSGYQTLPWNINSSLPNNYHQINVEKEIPANDDADGDGKCDYPLGDKCAVSKEGDNHRGYMGFRNSTDTTKLVNNGVIDIVIKSWDTSK
jgi:pimeloyl-ACP methyl ester carboxylesterase